MARFNHGALTRTKGKLGGIVFQQYEGMQIGKEYQPNVQNPNAPMQIATRTRFSLASKTVAMLFPWLSPVMKANGISYERFQRGDVLKKLMGVITYDDAEQHATMGQFPIIRPNSPTHVFGVSTSITSNTVNITATSSEAEDKTPYFVLCTMFPADGSVPIVHTEANSMDGTSNTTDFALPTGFQGSIVTLCYGAIPTEETSGVSYGEIAGAISTDIATLPNDASLRTIAAITNLAQHTLWHA